MLSPRLIFKLLPWLMLTVMIFTLYITSRWPFVSSNEQQREMIETTTILNEIENIGRLELVKYRFKEIFDYQKLSESKAVGSAILKTYDFNPDLKVVLIATGEAVGCIDLQKMDASDIRAHGDTIIISLPAPELCYYKLDLENTKIYSFNKESWLSRLFSDDEEKNQALEAAYRKAEKAIREAALQSGILTQTNENAVNMLTPMLENLTGKSVLLITAMPAHGLDKDL